jgi:hypothetical protein
MTLPSRGRAPHAPAQNLANVEAEFERELEVFRTEAEGAAQRRSAHAAIDRVFRVPIRAAEALLRTHLPKGVLRPGSPGGRTDPPRRSSLPMRVSLRCSISSIARASR